MQDYVYCHVLVNSVWDSLCLLTYILLASTAYVTFEWLREAGEGLVQLLRHQIPSC